MKTVAFFNNKGGVGKTSLVYHLAWMFADLGVTTLAVDLDPQANLTSMFLEESRLETLWDDNSRETVFGCIQPLMKATGDLARPHVENISERLGLIAGDLALSGFEDSLSDSWPKAVDRKEAAFRILTAFHRMIVLGADSMKADLVLIDVGPNLGAINRMALIAAQHVVVPLAPDLFSMQGLKNLGPTLRGWREGWADRLNRAPRDMNIPLPEGTMRPAGYIVMQHSIRDSRPVKAYQRWMDRIPKIYRKSVLNESTASVPTVDKDPNMLAMLKHYRSLMPLAMEARKPMFSLKPSDGAIGAHTEAVKNCYGDFKLLAKSIGESVGLSMPKQ